MYKIVSYFVIFVRLIFSINFVIGSSVYLFTLFFAIICPGKITHLCSLYIRYGRKIDIFVLFLSIIYNVKITTDAIHASNLYFNSSEIIFLEAEYRKMG